MADFPPFNKEPDTFRDNIYKAPTIEGLSFPGQRGDGMVYRKFQSDCPPDVHRVRKVPGQFYVQSFADSFRDYAIPRIAADYNQVPRLRKFPLDNELDNKSFALHLGNDETYYMIFKHPNRCNADFCKQRQ